ncbi:MAG TPA: mandelate racemase/muconate lactonizing enzyme family protein [Streptosporangiaceae bacterium]
MNQITSMSSRACRLRMPVPWGPGRDHQYLIVTELVADDGATGTGFTWTVDAGARAILAMLDDDCRPVAVGSQAVPGPLWDRLRWHLRETGSGIATLALASVDIGLWDLRARAGGVSLAGLIGKHREQAGVYASGVNRHLSLDELTEQVSRWVAAGHSRVKIKVGLPDLDEDVERVAAVRRVIGPRRHLMVDANQLWDLPRARRAAAALARYNIFWLEEPLPANDTSGYARLRAAIDIPIAAGESLFAEAEFLHLLVSQGCDIIQPNVCRVGGITPFLRIASLARAFSVPVMPHLLPDISGQLALCLPMSPLVEDIDHGSFAALGALERPGGIDVQGDSLRALPGLGHGLAFTLAAAEAIS